MIQINLGYGTDGPYNGPPNMSNIMTPMFQFLGPTNAAWPGTICLPQVPLPAGAQVKPGDLATIQVVELAQHGAALYAVCRLPVVQNLRQGEREGDEAREEEVHASLTS